MTTGASLEHGEQRANSPTTKQKLYPWFEVCPSIDKAELGNSGKFDARDQRSRGGEKQKKRRRAHTTDRRRSNQLEDLYSVSTDEIQSLEPRWPWPGMRLISISGKSLGERARRAGLSGNAPRSKGLCNNLVGRAAASLRSCIGASLSTAHWAALLSHQPGRGFAALVWRAANVLVWRHRRNNGIPVMIIEHLAIISFFFAIKNVISGPSFERNFARVEDSTSTAPKTRDEPTQNHDGSTVLEWRSRGIMTSHLGNCL